MKPLRISALFVVGWILVAASGASATVISIGTGAFGAGSTLTTFSGLADGLEVNGLTVGGITFLYSLGNGQVVIDGGPGVTSNITPPNIVSIGNNTGVLSMMLPSLVDSFGYGFAILATTSISPATTISLFNGATPVGGLSFGGTPEPTFTGGFAGVQSTLAFNRVNVTFNSVAAPAFALDNIRTANNGGSAIPEPASLLLVATGIGALARRRRRVR